MELDPLTQPYNTGLDYAVHSNLHYNAGSPKISRTTTTEHQIMCDFRKLMDSEPYIFGLNPFADAIIDLPASSNAESDQPGAKTAKLTRFSTAINNSNNLSLTSVTRQNNWPLVTSSDQ